MHVARYHGVDPDPNAVRLDAAETVPSSPVLVEWFRQSGLWARGTRLNFRQLMKIDSPAPILLLLSDGGAALVVGRNREHGVLLVRDPRAPGAERPVPVGRTPPQAGLGWRYRVGARLARQQTKTRSPSISDCSPVWSGARNRSCATWGSARSPSPS